MKKLLCKVFGIALLAALFSFAVAACAPQETPPSDDGGGGGGGSSDTVPDSAEGVWTLTVSEHGMTKVFTYTVAPSGGDNYNAVLKCDMSEDDEDSSAASVLIAMQLTAKAGVQNGYDISYPSQTYVDPEIDAGTVRYANKKLTVSAAAFTDGSMTSLEFTEHAALPATALETGVYSYLDETDYATPAIVTATFTADACTIVDRTGTSKACTYAKVGAFCPIVKGNAIYCIAEITENGILIDLESETAFLFQQGEIAPFYRVTYQVEGNYLRDLTEDIPASAANKSVTLPTADDNTLTGAIQQVGYDNHDGTYYTFSKWQKDGTDYNEATYTVAENTTFTASLASHTAEKPTITFYADKDDTTTEDYKHALDADSYYYNVEDGWWIKIPESVTFGGKYAEAQLDCWCIEVKGSEVELDTAHVETIIDSENGNYKRLKLKSLYEENDELPTEYAIYAKWSGGVLTEYTLTWEAGDAEDAVGIPSPATETHVAGDTITIPEDPSCGGYIFVGWRAYHLIPDSEGGSGQWVEINNMGVNYVYFHNIEGKENTAYEQYYSTFTMIGEDVHLIAGWSGSVTISYSFGDGYAGETQEYQPEQVAEYSSYTLKDAPVWADHYFVCWRSEDGHCVPAGEELTVLESHTYTALWATEATLTIQFQVKESVLSGYDVTVTPGQTLAGKHIPSGSELGLADNETFNYWTLDEVQIRDPELWYPTASCTLVANITTREVIDPGTAPFTLTFYADEEKTDSFVATADELKFMSDGYEDAWYVKLFTDDHRFTGEHYGEPVYLWYGYADPYGYGEERVDLEDNGDGYASLIGFTTEGDSWEMVWPDTIEIFADWEAEEKTPTAILYCSEEWDFSAQTKELTPTQTDDGQWQVTLPEFSTTGWSAPEGQQFKSYWYQNTEMTETIVTNLTVSLSDVFDQAYGDMRYWFFIKWEPASQPAPETKSYTFNFYKEKAEDYADQPTVGTTSGEYAEGATLNSEHIYASDGVTKQYYEFAGWYYTKDGVDYEFNTSFVPSDSSSTTISVFAKWTVKIEIGSSDYSTSYNVLESALGWKDELQKGEKIVLSGTHSSKGDQVWRGAVLVVYTSGDPAGGFRCDNFVNSEVELEAAEHWAITSFCDWTKDNEEAWKALLVQSNVTVTFDWTHDETIMLQLAYSNNEGLTYTQRHIIVAAEENALASSYKIGISVDLAHVEFTEWTDTQVEGGTQHDFSNGACPVCGLVCDHAGESGTCSKCGATLEEHTASDAWADIYRFNEKLTRNGNKLMVYGTQTSNMANNWDTVNWELTDGFTGRLDNYGWRFDEDKDSVDTTFGRWKTDAHPEGTSTSGLLVNRTADGSLADPLFAWKKFQEICKDCHWLIEAYWTQADVIEVVCHVTANSGTYEGYTYSVHYNIKLEEELTELGFRITGDVAAYTSAKVTGYKVVPLTSAE